MKITPAPPSPVEGEGYREGDIFNKCRMAEERFESDTGDTNEEVV